MKGIIIYKSKYNTTKEYAEWISEETEYPAVNVKDVEIKALKNFDVIIIASPVIAASPSLAAWTEKNWSVLKEKKIYFVTTSGAPSTDPGLKEAFKNSLSKEIHQNITYYPLSGKMIYKNLTLTDKILMQIGKMVEKDPKVKEEMGKDVDGVNRGEIRPLVEDVKSYVNAEQN